MERFLTLASWRRQSPADLQALIERNNTKYATLNQADSKELEQSLRTKLAQQGMTIVPVDTSVFTPALRGYFREWADTFGTTEWGLLQTSLGRRLV